MSPSTRRLPALALSAALGTALLAAAPSASAVPGEGVLFAGTAFSRGGTATCELVDNGDGDNAPLLANGVPVTRTYTTTGTVIDSADVGDFTQLAAKSTSTARATLAGGSLSTLELSTFGQTSASAVQGEATECQGDAEATGGTMLEFSLANPGWLTLTTTTTAGGESQIVVQSASGDQAVMEVDRGTHGTSTRRMFFPAGIYMVQIAHSVWSSTDGGPAAASASMKGTVTFAPAGAATAAAAGTGTPYVALGARSCAADSVTATFPSAKLRKRIASTTFLVNGVKKATVKKATTAPVVLTGISDTAAATVQAVVQLKDTKKKGKKVKGKKVVTARSYLPCG